MVRGSRNILNFPFRETAQLFGTLRGIFINHFSGYCFIHALVRVSTYQLLHSLICHIVCPSEVLASE